VDGSTYAKKVLENAINFAKMSGASITIMYVIHARVYAAVQEAGFVDINIARKMEELGSSILEEAKVTAQNGGINCNTKLVHGFPSEEIVKTAEAEKYDMIVIGIRGRTGARAALLGSISNSVNHHAKCPVLIVK